MVQTYLPPVNISPFIRFSRWALLVSGIAYGAFWNSRYHKYEERMKPIWAKEKAERDAFLAKEKQRLSDLEIKDLEKLGQ